MRSGRHGSRIKDVNSTRDNGERVQQPETRPVGIVQSAAHSLPGCSSYNNPIEVNKDYLYIGKTEAGKEWLA